MKKAASLRAALSAAVPEFRKNPSRLRLWIEDGSGMSRQTPDLSFAFEYRLNVLVEETATDIALIALALFRWLRVNQPELLSPGARGFAFDADILDNETADILFQLDLRENVAVAPREEGGFSLDYVAEPDPLFEDELGAGGLPEIPDLAEVQTDLDQR